MHCEVKNMNKVTGDMTIGEVVRMHPDASRVLMSFGMGCIS